MEGFVCRGGEEGLHVIHRAVKVKEKEEEELLLVYTLGGRRVSSGIGEVVVE